MKSPISPLTINIDLWVYKDLLWDALLITSIMLSWDALLITSIMLSKETKICINYVLYSSKSRRNLLSFKDISYNGYHIETNNESNEEYLYITSMVSG